MVHNTFVINPIRTDYIERCLETLYAYTPGNFKVIVVDQTKDGILDKVEKYTHLYLRPHRNLGFSKSMNEGIIHGMRWNSKYITVMNDDIEFMDHRWWYGIEQTFDMDERIMAVNPMSPREPGWGYGLEHGEYIDILPYKETYKGEDYDFLLEGDFTGIDKKGSGFPDKKNGVIDAIATWCTVFRRDCIDQFGYFEERYYPGGGEDYDYNARVYRNGFRMVGTTKSWVWHWWGSSKDHQGALGEQNLPIEDKYRWNNSGDLWPVEKNNGQQMDPWGKWTDKDGNKHPMYRVPEIGIVEI